MHERSPFNEWWHQDISRSILPNIFFADRNIFIANVFLKHGKNIFYSGWQPVWHKWCQVFWCFDDISRKKIENIFFGKSCSWKQNVFFPMKAKNFFEIMLKVLTWTANVIKLQRLSVGVQFVGHRSKCKRLIPNSYQNSSEQNLSGHNSFGQHFFRRNSDSNKKIRTK
jgi:hypothetical protein